MLATILAAAILLSLTSASPVQPDAEHNPGSIYIPIIAKVTNYTHSSKRQISTPVDDPFARTFYTTAGEFIPRGLILGVILNQAVEIGTPSQLVELIIDTSAYATWVNPTCSTAGDQVLVGYCGTLFRYDSDSSATFTYYGLPDTVFSSRGSASIIYSTDDIKIGGSVISDALFGIAVSSSGYPSGILGIGAGFETIGVPSVLDYMASDGLIHSRFFSLDLRAGTNSRGSLIFGGIDKSKYIGPLEKLKILSKAQSPDHSQRYWVTMNNVGITENGVAKLYGLTTTVTFDSGSTLSRLPTAIVDALAADFPTAVWSSALQLYTVDCVQQTKAGTVDFVFRATTISVPYNDIIYQTQTGVCVLGIAPVNDNSFALGDTFLRAAYLSIDQDNQNVHLAQAADCGLDVRDISAPVGSPVGPIVGNCNAAPAPVYESPSSSTSFSYSPPTSTSAAITSSSISPSSSTSEAISSSSVGTISSEEISITSTYAIESSTIAHQEGSTTSSSLIFEVVTSTAAASSSAFISITSTYVIESSATTLQEGLTTSSSLLFEVVTSTAPASLSTFATITVTGISSTTPPAVISPGKCNQNNCLRALQKASATLFCLAYEAGIAIPTPSNVAKGCSESKLSSGCACLVGVPATTAPPSVSTSSMMVMVTTTTVPNTVTPQKPSKCNRNNCFRAVLDATPSSFCPAFLAGGVVTPTAVAKKCAGNASKISSACACVPT